MHNVYASPLPASALLNRYKKDGYYTDCYVTELPFSVTHEKFVLAFYTTKLFKLERLILKLVLSRSSSDEQAATLAAGQREKFAAWSVEDRCSNQILMCDFQERTRSWLMTVDSQSADSQSTKLFFGSAVVPIRNKRTGVEGLGIGFRLLLGLHKLYSVVLLSSAAAKLLKANR